MTFLPSMTGALPAGRVGLDLDDGSARATGAAGGEAAARSSPADGSGPDARRSAAPRGKRTRPRLGFLGVGWIGEHRLRAAAASRTAEIAAVADADPARAASAAAAAAEAANASGSRPGTDVRIAESLEDLLASDLDGIVIATPSALHAGQAVAALEAGVAVFCQKPLGRTAFEARRVVDAARAADRLLAVDLCYRHLAAMKPVRELVAGGELGRIYAADLVFHNAYGPDKPWFFDPALAGGGCVMDLGVHLVDLALWTLGFPRIAGVSSRLVAGGEPLEDPSRRVEDYAVARLDLETGAVVTLACSWCLPAGRDARIEASFYGTSGGVRMHNIGGSFYDFAAERFAGTARRVLAEPPDDWGGRAILAWVSRLGLGEGFDPAAERLVDVAAALDAIYGR